MNIYRIFIDNQNRTDPPTGATGKRYTSGASYAGCSPTTPLGCDPRDFDTLTQLEDYAQLQGETPVQVYSQPEAWAYVQAHIAEAGGTYYQAPGSSDMGFMAIAAIAVLAFLFFRKGH